MQWWNDYRWKRFYADNFRKLLALEAERVAKGMERWGYSSYAKDVRKGWAKASDGKRAHWRQLAKRGY